MLPCLVSPTRGTEPLHRPKGRAFIYLLGYILDAPFWVWLATQKPFNTFSRSEYRCPSPGFSRDGITIQQGRNSESSRELLKPRNRLAEVAALTKRGGLHRSARGVQPSLLKSCWNDSPERPGGRGPLNRQNPRVLGALRTAVCLWREWRVSCSFPDNSTLG